MKLKSKINESNYLVAGQTYNVKYDEFCHNNFYNKEFVIYFSNGYWCYTLRKHFE